MSRHTGSNNGSWSRRKILASGALAGLFGAPSLAQVTQGAVTTNPTTSLPWRNWSGGLVSQPKGRISPSTTSALAEYLTTTTGAIRPVGSGHSFAPLVPTDGHLLVLDQLSGLIAHDPATLRATFGAGTRLSDIGPALTDINQAMLNLPDIDRQTLAGAISTATHGTGIKFTCLSGFLTDLHLMTAAGATLELNETNHPERFHAAMVSLGALGIITQATLQNRSPYRLKLHNGVSTIEDALQTFDAKAAEHRHFEMFPLTHSDYALTLAIDETDEPINNPPPSAEEAAALGNAMAYWATLPPKARLPVVNSVAEDIEASSLVDESYKVLSNIRNNRFNEMEYSVPLHNGADCLREIVATIIKAEVDVLFPLEYRYVKRDNSWLSMSAGDEDHAAISIHRIASQDYGPYFNLIEPIFWKYGGRPHWGKIHSLGAPQLAKLYPRFSDFQKLRAELDPAGRFLNEHLRKLFIG